MKSSSPGIPCRIEPAKGSARREKIRHACPERPRPQPFLIVPLSTLRVGPAQLRRQLERQALEDLKRSIESYGLLEPLIVRRKEETLELICGHRRYEAAKQLGLDEIPVVIRDTSDEDLGLVALQENLHRDGMNPVDEALSYRQLLDAGRARTRTELASLVGVTKGRISQVLALLDLPAEVQGLMFTQVNSSRPPLTEKHARILRRILEPDQQVHFARLAFDQGLSPDQLELAIRGELRVVQSQPAGSGSRASSWKSMESARYRRSKKGLQFELDGRPHQELVKALERLLATFRQDAKHEID